jgi:hypothetical protein
MAYGIGSNLEGLIYFRQAGTLLKVPPPKGSFREGAEARELASGGVRWVGYPQVTWHWDFMRAEWYDALRDICTAASGTVLIDTTTNDDEDAFALYWVKYSWPLELEKDSYRRMDFDITFKVVPPGEETRPEPEPEE